MSRKVKTTEYTDSNEEERARERRTLADDPWTSNCHA